MIKQELSNKIIHNIISKQQTDNIVTIYLSGSRCDAMTHKYSDYDIYVCLNTNIPTDCIDYSLDSQCRIQIHYIDFSHLKKGIEEINSNGEKYLLAPTSFHQLIWRYYIGKPIYQKSRFNLTKVSIVYKNLKCNIIQAYKIELNNGIEDFWGLYEDNDIESAFYWSKSLAGIAFDLYLSLHGELAKRDKFRTRKARRSLNNDDYLWSSYKSIVNHNSVSDIDSKYFEDVSNFFINVESKYVEYILENE